MTEEEMSVVRYLAANRPDEIGSGANTIIALCDEVDRLRKAINVAGCDIEHDDRKAALSGLGAALRGEDQADG